MTEQPLSFESVGGRKMKHLVTSCLCLGHLPVAPGTWGTLLGVVIFVAARSYLGAAEPYAIGAVVLLLLWASVKLTPWAEAYHKRRDPPEFVMDEVAGYLVAALLLPADRPLWMVVLWSFAFFRFFDVLKPFPIRRIERLPGWRGVMLDDVLAGVFANICVQVILRWAIPVAGG